MTDVIKFRLYSTYVCTAMYSLWMGFLSELKLKQLSTKQQNYKNREWKCMVPDDLKLFWKPHTFTLHSSFSSGGHPPHTNT